LTTDESPDYDWDAVLFPEHLCLMRGGGDLATGTALRLHRAGFPVAICELERPLTVRRAVAASTALSDPSGVSTIEEMVAQRVDRLEELGQLAGTGVVPVIAFPDLPPVELTPRSVVVDARLLKHNPDTSIGDAPLVVALGPGYFAGRDCHAVIETLRGPNLGRVIHDGPAEADTGTPGVVGGRSSERVLRSPACGEARWIRTIGDRVSAGELLGHVGGAPVVATLDGVVRGLVSEETPLKTNMKVGDIDPRHDTRIDRVSDKALAVGGGVLEAVTTWLDHAA